MGLILFPSVNPRVGSGGNRPRIHARSTRHTVTEKLFTEQTFSKVAIKDGQNLVVEAGRDFVIGRLTVNAMLGEREI